MQLGVIFKREGITINHFSSAGTYCGVSSVPLGKNVDVGGAQPEEWKDMESATGALHATEES